MHEILSTSASSVAELIRTGQISAAEVARIFIERIKVINPLLNAIHDFDPERILEQAQQADKAVAHKQKLGQLHGVPITLKDAFYSPGFKGSKGSVSLFKSATAERCATIVKRLIDEGAIILGISNIPEFAASFETDNLIYGRTNNPYDLRLTPGGSSGGEAAIIAAGGSPLGIGSDAGGSVRQPAHYCGICGFKPTRGAVPLTGNIPSDTPGLHRQLLAYGPMARHVDDLVLAFSIIRGPDGIDPDVPPIISKMPTDIDVKGLKAAYFLDNGIVPLNLEMKEIIQSAIAKISGAVSIMDKNMPSVIDQSFRLVWETFFWGGDKDATIDGMLSKMGQTEYSPLYKQFMTDAKLSSITITEFRQRFVDIDVFRSEMFKFMHDYDILISPVAASPARPHGTTHENIKEFSYTMTYNLTGWPVVVIPCGVTSSGLPVGIQIAAKPWHDEIALAAAKVFQNIFGILPVMEVEKKVCIPARL